MSTQRMTRSKNDRRSYDFRAFEDRWRPRWEVEDLYRTGDDPDRTNVYILDYFPYPSGDGLSVGHCRNYVPSCVSARFHRMRGYNVLHPMGWDAFGLPAENYAVNHGIHPAESTQRFTDTYRRQMRLIECSYDWSREINSTDPAYYRWTQWFFLLLFKRGLAYQAEGSQWWCPTCRTILANEQVENGRCWRCESQVTRKALRQWYFRITDYADRLLAGLETVDWPERIKAMQRRWIGRTEGAEVVFSVSVGDQRHAIPVFTTRPDTLFGATYLALAPEHPLVEVITAPEQAAAVRDYIEAASRESDIDRAAADRPKTGVFTGAWATRPLDGATVPVWVADYVLPGYGTGAIMGVPAHDARDFAFAQAHGLEVVTVIVAQSHDRAPTTAPDSPAGAFEVPLEETGTVIASGPYSGLASAEAAARITAELAAHSAGGPRVTTRLRDWLISRQRYWGAPIPIIHCADCGSVPVPEADLPVRLPAHVYFRPTGDGRSPLAQVSDWVNVPCPACGGPARRETDTMDGFACSSWYFLRFASPHEDERPFDPEAVRAWLPVDSYIGGAEHAVMHLLYARFWTKVMADEGLIGFDEPFSRLRNQGMLLSAVDGQKMSKSRGNVVTPDDVVGRFGVDALRAYVLFLGPFDADVVWDDRGIVGIARFLERYYTMARRIASAPGNNRPFDEAFERTRGRIIRRVTDDMERFRFNTAIAALMEFQNALASAALVGANQRREALRTLTLLLAPIVPFVTEEVWREMLGERTSVHRAAWPVFAATEPAAEVVTIVVQVDGKLRDRIEMPGDSDDETLRAAALQNERVCAVIAGRQVVETIVVPGRLVNVVTRP